MAGKSKFQISRLLDEKIKRISINGLEYEPEFKDIEEASIIGFHTSNVTNYLGLTTNSKLHNGGLQIVGLALFKSTPEPEAIKTRLINLIDQQGPRSFKTDKNTNFFLIYSFESDTGLTNKRIFDLNLGSYLEEQPKLSVLDAEKLFNHSAIVRVDFPLTLSILNNEAIDESLTIIDGALEKVTFSMKESGFSTNLSLDNKLLTETLYDHLDPPKDVDQMGDYLPQMTKEDKRKLVDKWHNKVKAQRLTLEFKLQHDNLSCTEIEQSKHTYRLCLDVFTFIHMTDPISKSLSLILYTLRQYLSILKHTLELETSVDKLEENEIKLCTFRPTSLGHFVPAVYRIPRSREPNFGSLKTLRRELHDAYLVPLDRPQFRYTQRVLNSKLVSQDEEDGFLCNVHKEILDKSGIKGGTRNVIEGTYTYYHYMQARINDSGWGCAYRSLQTVISWFKHQGYIYSPDIEPKVKKNDQSESLRHVLMKESRVPSHEEIQKTLVDIGDKQASFIGSQKWIGSQEVCYVLNHLYNLDSKFISVSSGSELVYKARDLSRHFSTQSTPVMIGGGVLAHTIIGVDFNEKNGDISYLILDPHYTGSEDLAIIAKKGWCGWKKNTFWDKNSFYNLCVPQRPIEF